MSEKILPPPSADSVDLAELAAEHFGLQQLVNEGFVRHVELVFKQAREARNLLNACFPDTSEYAGALPRYGDKEPYKPTPPDWSFYV